MKKIISNIMYQVIINTQTWKTEIGLLEKIINISFFDFLTSTSTVSAKGITVGFSMSTRS